MVGLRRFLVGVLTVAVAHFGVMATAPAHAHDEAGGHGIREIVLTHGHDEAVAPHEHGDHHEPAGMPDGPPTEDSGHGEHAHVHVTPQFTPASGVVVSTPIKYAAQTWPTVFTPGVSHSSSPPLRPPRLIL